MGRITHPRRVGGQGLGIPSRGSFSHLRLIHTILLLAFFICFGNRQAHAVTTAGSVQNLGSGLEYGSIQAAVDAASPADVLQAGPGVYNEVVTLNKALTLQTSDGAAATTLEGGILIQADNVNLIGFTLRGGADNGAGGLSLIQITGRSGCSVEGNMLDGGGSVDIGIQGEPNTRNLMIFDNEIQGCQAGLELLGTTVATLMFNHIHNNSVGLLTYGLAQSYLGRNRFINNGYGWEAVNQGSNVSIELSVFTGNATALWGESGNAVDARNNWWGHASGPSGAATDPVTHATANGLGDPVAAGARFDPWLIGPEPSITVTAPAYGAIWQKQVGATQTIHWQSSQVAGNVKIFVSLDSGPWLLIASDRPNTGTFNWTINTPASTAARIRVTAMQCNSIYGESGSFQIVPEPLPANITVTAPAAGAALAAGSAQTIRWTSTAVSGNIKIFTSVSGGPWQLIAWDKPNAGSFNWTVNTAASNAVKIRVTSMASNAVYGESGIFSVLAAPSLTVGTPGAGAIWLRGTAQTIQWTSANLAGNVKIFLSTAGGPWQCIGWDRPNTGAFAWTVKGAPTTQARIRVTSMQNNAVFDDSDSFTIQ